MRTWIRADQVATAATCVIIMLIAYVVSAPAFVEAQKPPIRIAFNAWPGYEFFSLANELGYFEDEGVEVKLIKQASLGDARRTFERGQTDLLASSMAEVIYIANENVTAIKTIAIADYSMGADMLLTRREFASVSDLRGKRIAIEPHSLDVVNLAFSLKSAGMNLSDVVVVPMPQNEMTQAFDLGTIDAAQSYPPISVSLLRNERIHSVFDTSAIPGVIVDCVSASPQAIQQRRPDIIKVMRAFFRAQRFFLNHPDQASTILCKHLQLSSAELQSTMKGIGLVPLPEQQAGLADSGQFVKSLEEATTQMRTIGLSPRMLDRAAWVDDSIVREVTKP